MNKSKKNKKQEFPGSEHPFRVPNGYFDSFSDSLMARIEQQEKPLKATPAIIRYLKPALAMAASFTIIFFLIYTPIRLINGTSNFTASNETELYETDFFDFYYMNSQSVYDLIYSDNNDDELYSDELLEAYLLASLSDYDLFKLTEN